MQAFNNLELLNVEILSDVQDWQEFPKMLQLKTLKVRIPLYMVLSSLAVNKAILHLVRNTPNVRDAHLHGCDICNEDLKVIYYGWPYLTNLMCRVGAYNNADELKTFMEKYCRNMKTFISHKDNGAKWIDDDWWMFESVPTLRLVFDFKSKKTFTDYCEYLQTKEEHTNILDKFIQRLKNR